MGVSDSGAEARVSIGFFRFKGSSGLEILKMTSNTAPPTAPLREGSRLQLGLVQVAASAELL